MGTQSFNFHTPDVTDLTYMNDCVENPYKSTFPSVTEKLPRFHSHEHVVFMLDRAIGHGGISNTFYRGLFLVKPHFKADVCRCNFDDCSLEKAAEHARSVMLSYGAHRAGPCNWGELLRASCFRWAAMSILLKICGLCPMSFPSLHPLFTMAQQLAAGPGWLLWATILPCQSIRRPFLPIALRTHSCGTVPAFHYR